MIDPADLFNQTNTISPLGKPEIHTKKAETNKSFTFYGMVRPYLRVIAPDFSST